jgi:ribonuclease BN (tRNA processing enzyme)
MILAEESQCKKLIFSHIGQHYSDEVLDKVASTLDSSKYIIATDGMEILV